MHFPTRNWSLLLVALAAACDAPLEVAAPDGVRSVGVLAWEAAPAASLASGRDAPTGNPRPGVVAPDTVRAGVPFSVVVVTVGATTCWRPAGAEVVEQPASAAVTPLDFTAEGPHTACGDALVELSRTVGLVFRQPGEATLRVHGRRVVGAEFQAGEPVVVEKRIRVL